MKPTGGDLLIAHLDGGIMEIAWDGTVRKVATGDWKRPEWVVILDPIKGQAENVDAAFDAAVAELQHEMNEGDRHERDERVYLTSRGRAL
jgi:hypothetical protein